MPSGLDSSWLDVPRPPRGARFLTTRWSLVRSAGATPSPESRAALEELCAAYWFPLYALLRRRGAGADEARDLAQGLFALILERRDLAELDPGRGRFRAWLAAAARHYLLNEREREAAVKRGGGVAPLSLDAAEAEGRLAAEPSHEETPERAFERAWARSVLDRALAAVAEEYRARGQGPLFDALRPHLEGERDAAPLAELAELLGTTEGALKTAAWRLRQRFGECLRTEVAETVADPSEIDDELRHLAQALAGDS
jgi:RNA polymerase sigma-70 factor (ECF subfamily)